MALADLRLHWTSGGAGCPRGPRYWPPIVVERKRIHEAMRAWKPPPALGRAPGVITDPVTIMHWGITSESVQEWLATSDGEQRDTLTGLPGSPGVADGVARVIRSSERIDEIRAGEILIASVMLTSWTPVFSMISGRCAGYRRRHVSRGDRCARVRPAGCTRHRDGDEAGSRNW